MKKIVVVGAGISGLSVAFRLKKKGYNVSVFERKTKAGGNIETLRDRGYLIELGPQTLMADQYIEDFLKEINLKPLRANPISKNRYIYRKGKLIPLPLNPVSFFLSPLLSFRAKLKIFTEPFIPPTEKEESIADFVKRRLGKEFLDYIVTPFISGVYAGDPYKLSVKYAVKRIYMLEKEYGSLIKGALKKKAIGPKGKLISFEGGLKALTDRLSEYVKVEKEREITALEIRNRKFILKTKKEEKEADAVVLSTPAYETAQILKTVSEGKSLILKDIDYVPVVVVNLGVKSGKIPEGFGFLIPRTERKRILGVIFSSKLFTGRSPVGRDLLTVYMGGATDREVINLTEEEILKIVSEELKDILEVESVDFYHVKKWEKAIPQYTMGYEKFLKTVEELENTFKGLFLTGNYIGGISLADCIRNSEEISRRVEEFLTLRDGNG